MISSPMIKNGYVVVSDYGTHSVCKHEISDESVRFCVERGISKRIAHFTGINTLQIKM